MSSLSKLDLGNRIFTIRGCQEMIVFDGQVFDAYSFASWIIRSAEKNIRF